MHTQLRPFTVVLALLLPWCGHFVRAAAPSVLLDVDLTQGKAGTGAVNGGAWDGGWRVTAHEQRIVWDLGGPVREGTMEVTFTTSKPPYANVGKVNWAGIYESPEVSQNSVPQLDILYVRTGSLGYGFSKFKVWGAGIKKEFEKSWGDAQAWIADDRTVMTIRLEWNDRFAAFTDPTGATLICPPEFCQAPYALDRLQYVCIGGDRRLREGQTSLSAIGVRFLRVKVTGIK